MSADEEARRGARSSDRLWIWFAKLAGLAAFGIGVVVFATWWQKNYSGPTILDQNTSSAPGGRADGAPQNSHLKVPDGPSSLAAQPRRLTVGEIIAKVGPGVVLLSCLDSKGKEYGLGSGFVIDSSGLVATSFHVVRRAWKVNATFSDGAKVAVAGCRAWDADSDLAILELAKLPAAKAPLQLSDNEDHQQADQVIAIGHPQGFKFTTTTGIISGVHKTSELPAPYSTEIHAPAENVWIQTSAAISSGNSGGPLLDMDGQVVGINTWVAQGQNLGFAVDVRHLISLKEHLQPKPAPLAELTGPEERLESMIADFATQYEWMQDQAAKSWTTAWAKQFVESKHPALDFMPKFLQFAEDQRGKPSALHALAMVCQLAAMSDVPKSCGPTMKSAADRLLADYGNNERLIPCLTELTDSPLTEAVDFCRRVAKQTENHRLQGFALYSLALSLQGHTDAKSPWNDEAVAALERIVKEFTDVQLGESNLAAIADDTLFELQHLAVGRTAQEIEGTDADGTTFKLSDYRGKVVVLDFWVDWCPYCVAMYPVERGLVTKYAGKPFAILGVNCDEGSRFKRVLAAKTVTWRNWANGPDGPISEQWRVHSFPTLYVIDQNGVIRYRDVRGPELEAAIAALMTKNEPKSSARTFGWLGDVAAQIAKSEAKPPAPLTASAQPAANSQDLRTWTRADGKKAELRFVAVEGDNVRLQRPDGRDYVVPLAKLSQADQDWIRDHGKK